MSAPEKRARQPSVLRIKLKHKSVETFIERFAENVSHGGIFIATRNLKPVGTDVRFELLLADGKPAIQGEGRVAWLKEYDPDEPRRAHGMGIKLTKLPPKSREMLKRCLEWKQKLARRGELDDSGRIQVHTGSFDLSSVEARRQKAEKDKNQQQDGAGEEARPAEAAAEAEDAAVAPAPEGEPPAGPPVPLETPAADTARSEASARLPISSAPRPEISPSASAADLEALLAETGMAEARLAAVLEALRAELGQARAGDAAGELGGDLENLLAQEAPAPVTVDDATNALAQLLGGEPVRHAAAGPPSPGATASGGASAAAFAGASANASANDRAIPYEIEIRELTPPPMHIRPRSEIDELGAPLYSQLDDPVTRPAPARFGSGERPAVATPDAAPAEDARTAVGEEIGEELEIAIDELVEEVSDTPVDAAGPRFLGRGLVSDVVVDDIPDTVIRSSETTPAPPDGPEPGTPTGRERRRSSFFKKLFGK